MLNQRVILFCLIAGALPAACAAPARQGPSTSPPASPTSARQEIKELEQQNARRRAALGLPSLLQPVEAESPAPPAAGAASTPAEPDRVSSPAPEMPAEEATEEAASYRGPCSARCKISRAICSASRRICVIARYLGDADAIRRCQRARRDCRQSRRATEDDCSGCS